MNKSRLEAFSDGVIAVIITIMVLELKVPHSTDFNELLELYPVFLSYVLSFLYVGISWNTHHNILQAVKGVSGGILLANLHLLFWLSLIPFTTAWMGENHFAKSPTFLYGINLLLTGLSYEILISTIIRYQGKNSPLKKIANRKNKNIVTLSIYLAALAITYLNVTAAQLLYAIIALMRIIPDKTVEKKLSELNTRE